MYQHLFEAIIKVTGFTPLQSDMQEIINAYEKDMIEQYDEHFSEGHECKYCGAITRQDDELCFKNPNKQ